MKCSMANALSTIPPTLSAACRFSETATSQITGHILKDHNIFRKLDTLFIRVSSFSWVEGRPCSRNACKKNETLNSFLTSTFALSTV